MTTPTPDGFEEKARRIVAHQRGLSLANWTDWHSDREADTHEIAAALRAAAAVPKGHVKLDDGRVVKVLGTLPMTADGCAIGNGDYPLYHTPSGETHKALMMTLDSYGHSDEAYGPMLYSNSARSGFACPACRGRIGAPLCAECEAAKTIGEENA